MDTQLGAYVLVAFVLAVTPGADMALVTKNAIVRGHAAALRTTLGICLGCAVHAFASSLGLSMILARSAIAFETVKLIGAAYLVWLGFSALRTAARGAAELRSAGPAGTSAGAVRDRGRSGFVEGFLSNVLNPKVALFYMLVVPQFIDAGGDVLLQTLLLAGFQIGIGLVWLVVFCRLLDRLRDVMAQGRVRRAVEGATGLVLIFLGGRLALERR